MPERMVILGAASGIGRAVAAEAVARGADVFVIDVNGKLLTQTAAELGAIGSAVCDVADPDAVEQVSASVFETLGRVDLVFHAAGVVDNAAAIDTSPQNARWLVDVNLLGSIYVASSFTKRLVNQDTASRFVFTGSEHSLGVPHLGASTYTATKHAVLGYADVMRREMPSHVRVSILCPGLVATDLWRAGEHRGEAYGGALPVEHGSRAIIAAGMPVDEVATAFFDGIASDEFLIMTHGHVRRYATERYETIIAALDAQAPDPSDVYGVSAVIARLRDQKGSARATRSDSADAQAPVI